MTDKKISIESSQNSKKTQQSENWMDNLIAWADTNKIPDSCWVD